MQKAVKRTEKSIKILWHAHLYAMEEHKKSQRFIMDEIKNDFSSSLVGVTQETITINYNRLLLGGSPGSLCGCEG